MTWKRGICTLLLVFPLIAGQAHSHPCDDILEGKIESEIESGNDEKLDPSFSDIADEIRRRLIDGPALNPRDPLLGSASGKLALLDALATPGGKGLLQLDKIMSTDATDNPRLGRLQRKLTKFGDRLQLSPGVRWNWGILPRLSIKLRTGLSHRELARLVDQIYGLSTAAIAELEPPGTRSTALATAAALFWRPLKKSGDIFRTNSENLIRERVEKILLTETMEKAISSLGLGRSQAIHEAFKTFRLRHGNKINVLIALAINYPLMSLLATSVPLYLPKLKLVEGKKLADGILQPSREMLADGFTFEEHWQTAKERYTKEFGWHPAFDQSYGWSRKLFSMLIGSMVGLFIIQNSNLILNLLELEMTSDEDLKKLEDETFDSVRIREELFQSGLKSYIAFKGKPEPACTGWLKSVTVPADKARQDPTIVRKRLADRLEGDLQTDETGILKKCLQYLKFVMKEFVTLFHERTDCQIRLYVAKQTDGSTPACP